MAVYIAIKIEQCTNATAMCHTNGRPFDRFHPSTDTLREPHVAFSGFTRRNEVPLVVGTGFHEVFALFGNVFHHEALPVAEIYFHKLRISTEVIRIETHAQTNTFHRLARAAQWTCNKIVARAVADQRFEHITIAIGLRATMGIDINIELPLNALRNIPVRFAVTRKIDDLPSQNPTSICRLVSFPDAHIIRKPFQIFAHALFLDSLPATGKT